MYAHMQYGGRGSPTPEISRLDTNYLSIKILRANNFIKLRGSAMAPIPPKNEAQKRSFPPKSEEQMTLV